MQGMSWTKQDDYVQGAILIHKFSGYVLSAKGWYKPEQIKPLSIVGLSDMTLEWLERNDLLSAFTKAYTIYTEEMFQQLLKVLPSNGGCCHHVC